MASKKELDEKMTIEIENKIVTANISKTGADILEGQKYIARRNNNPWLLYTCKENKRKAGQHYIIPVEVGYYYDWCECHPVINVEQIDMTDTDALKLAIECSQYNSEKLRDEIVKGVLINPMINENYNYWEDKENNLYGITMKIKGNCFNIVIKELENEDKK